MLQRLFYAALPALPENRTVISRLAVPLVLFCGLLMVKVFFLDKTGIETPFLLFTFPIMFTAWYSGSAAAVMLTIWSMAAIHYFFMKDALSGSDTTFTVVIYSLFSIQALAIIYITHNMQQSIRQLKGESKKRIQNEQYYRTLLEQASEGIVLLGQDKKVTDYNTAAYRLLKEFKPDLKGSLFFQDIVSVKADDIKTDKDKLAVTLFEGEVIRGEGKHFPLFIEGSYTPVQDNTVLVIFRDVTKRRELETKQKDFLNTVSHELRTPLTALKSYLQLLKRKELPKEFHVYTDKSLMAVRKIEALLAHMSHIAFAQPMNLTLEYSAFSLNDLVRESVDTTSLVYNSSKVSLQLDDDVLLVADREKLLLVLTILISNALKYSGQDADVTIRTRGTKHHTDIVIYDRGIGIPRHELHHVFTSFFRSSITPPSHAGVGLGLFIAKEIVDKHGGKIDVDSEEGKGTVFTISLPFMDQAIA